MAAAKEFAREQAQAQKRDFVLVVTVLPANPGAKLLYEQLGFNVDSITETEIELVFEAEWPRQSRSRYTRTHFSHREL